VASAQRGVVTRDQCLAAGLTRSAIRTRLAAGRLHVIHRGVYAVGRPSLEALGREWAAALYLNAHGVLSHASAAALWGLSAREPAEVTLTVVGRDVRSRPGLRVHRALELDRRDLRNRHGLPVTSPSRTIVDLAAETPLDELESLLAEATVRRLVTPSELAAAAGRVPGHRGMAKIHALVSAEEDPALTRSKAERRLLALIRAAGLPAPLVNQPFLGYQLDMRWPAQKLVIEFDGFRFHGHRVAFERDRRRDQMLVAAGYRVMRVTWRQLEQEPLAVLARLAAALSLAAA